MSLIPYSFNICSTSCKTTHIVVGDDSDDERRDDPVDVGDHVGDAEQRPGVVGRQVHVVNLQ